MAHFTNEMRLVVERPFLAERTPVYIVARQDERAAQRSVFAGKIFWGRAIKPVAPPCHLSGGKAGGVLENFDAWRCLVSKPGVGRRDESALHFGHHAQLRAQERPELGRRS